MTSKDKLAAFRMKVAQEEKENEQGDQSEPGAEGQQEVEA